MCQNGKCSEQVSHRLEGNNAQFVGSMDTCELALYFTSVLSFQLDFVSFAFFDLAQSCIVQPCWVLVFFIILKNVIMYAEKFNMLNGLSVILRPVQ